MDVFRRLGAGILTELEEYGVGEIMWFEMGKISGIGLGGGD